MTLRDLRDVLARSGAPQAPAHVYAMVAALAGPPPPTPATSPLMAAELWQAQVRRVVDAVWGEAYVTGEQDGRLRQAAEAPTAPIQLQCPAAGQATLCPVLALAPDRAAG